MKSAACFLRQSTITSPKAPQLYGTQYIPASLVVELYGMLQAGQYSQEDNDQTTGEPRFPLNTAFWREDGSKGYVLSGRLDSPSERAAFDASRAQQGVTASQGPKWGAQPHQAAQAAPPQPPQPVWNGTAWVMPQVAPPAPAPQAAPAPQQQWAQPAPAPAAPAPQAAPGGWGGGWGR